MKNYTVNSFQILERCITEYETKILSALSIEKLNLELKKQLYAISASFLLSVFHVAMPNFLYRHNITKLLVPWLDFLFILLHLD